MKPKKTQMQVDVESACEAGRQAVQRYSGVVSDGDPIQAALGAYESEIRGYIEQDEQIEKARQAVTEKAATLRGVSIDDKPGLERARDQVVEAITSLEAVTLERGRQNVRASIKW